MDFQSRLPYVLLADEELALAAGHTRGPVPAGDDRDITGRKQAEETLRASEARLQSEKHYRLLAEAIPQIVWTARADGWLDYFNQRWFDYTGLTLEQTEGWSWLVVLHPDDRQGTRDRWSAAIATGEIFEIEYRFKSAEDGSYLWHLGRAVPLKDSAGHVARWFGTCTNIDDQKQAEARVRDAQTILELRVGRRTQELTRANRLLTAEIVERKRAVDALAHERASLAQRVEEQTRDLRAANAELERASRLKDEFLASMSHELRTPLNAILGLSEALQEQVYGPLNERQLKTLRTVEESGRHLLSLINDILELAKIDAGKVELQIGPVALNPVCQASLRLIQQAAHTKQLTVRYSCDSSVAVLQADERRLKQILVNLLSNAVKFTPAGGTIGLEIVSDRLQECAHLTVWDTGIGIAPADLDRLFQPFVQLDSRLAREYAGTGLGLALVGRMVELHDGSIAVASEVAKGSRFTVTLHCQAPAEAGGMPAGEEAPRALADASSRQSGAAGMADPARPPVILLAEDNPENIFTVSDYLAFKGYQVEVACTGAEALAQAAVVRPDVILMDMQMPDMDGLEATMHLRADAEFAETPIIALTGLAMPGDRSKCMAAGADAYLSKPVSLRELVDTIEVLRHRDN